MKRISILVLIAFFLMVLPAEAYEVLEEMLAYRMELDQRLTVFQITVSEENDDIILTGQVCSEEVLAGLKDHLKEAFPQANIIDNTQILELGYGMVTESYVNLLSSPNPGGDVVTQLIFASPVRILQERNSFFQVQGLDTYLGWVPVQFIQEMSREEISCWAAGEVVLIHSLQSSAYDRASTEGETLQSLLLGTPLSIIEEEGLWRKVFWPGSETLWVMKEDLRDVEQDIPSLREKILHDAHLYLGTPYVWGGTTIEGVDCSGFVQRVLAMNGIYYPRDSDQQYAFSEPRELEDLKPGDLVFFSTYRRGPSHVGFYLGDEEFIHAGSQAGEVAIHSLNPQSSIYSPYLANRFLGGMGLKMNRTYLAPWLKTIAQ